MTDQKPTKENTLYLPIKQIYFDQIIAGTKDKEYRDVKEGITANRYLLKNPDGKYALNPECTSPDKVYYVDDYNGGKFPFLPKPTIKYVYLAVGYAKERDTALIEVKKLTFEPTLIRANLFACWLMVIHLGKIMELHRK